MTKLKASKASVNPRKPMPRRDSVGELSTLNAGRSSRAARKGGGPLLIREYPVQPVDRDRAPAREVVRPSSFQADGVATVLRTRRLSSASHLWHQSARTAKRHPPPHRPRQRSVFAANYTRLARPKATTTSSPVNRQSVVISRDSLDEHALHAVFYCRKIRQGAILKSQLSYSVEASILKKVSDEVSGGLPSMYIRTS